MIWQRLQGPRSLGAAVQLYLPQISSWARGGRRIPAATQMFGLSSPATIEKHEKSTLRITKQTCVGKRELVYLSQVGLVELSKSRTAGIPCSASHCPVPVVPVAAQSS